MPARDDFGSTAGTSRGYSGGAGGLGNGGVGGGMGGGASGGGAGVNGGAGSQTGLTTGSTIYGNTAFGTPGQMAQGYATMDPRSMSRMGMAPTAELYSMFRNAAGGAMFPGLNNPMQSAIAPSAGAAAWGLNQLQQYEMQQRMRAQQGGLLGNPASPVQQPPASIPPAWNPPPVPEEAIPGYQPGYTYNNQMPPGYYGAMWGRNPTSYAQWSTGYHGQGNSYPGGLQENDLSLRNWSGNRVDVGAIGGGQGVQGYSSGNPATSYTGR